MSDRNTKKAAILLSRQSLQPSGTDRWVQQTLRALQWVKEHNLELLSSTGMLTWDLITVCASQLQIKQHLIVPVSGQDHDASTLSRILWDLRLDDATVAIEFLISPRRLGAQIRDHTIIQSADILIPISIRPQGRMAEMLEAKGKEIRREFEIPFQKRSIPLQYRLDSTDLSGELRKFESLNKPYLIHWTRAVNGKWPDETTAEFIGDLVAAAEHPRSAFATLRKILASKRLLASGRHMPNNYRTVSFSALKPSEALPLMRWRARYRQMSFEPYGVGIELETALETGFKPVIYAADEAKSKDSDNSWWYQSPGEKTDWRAEREYRYPGHFDFAAIPSDKIIAFCRFRAEAVRLQKETSLRSIPVQNR